MGDYHRHKSDPGQILCLKCHREALTKGLSNPKLADAQLQDFERIQSQEPASLHCGWEVCSLTRLRPSCCHPLHCHPPHSLQSVGMSEWTDGRAASPQDDSDFFSSQGSINSLDDEIVRKECLSALERSGIPLSQAPPAWPSNSSSAPGALPAPTGTDDSSTIDMLVSCRAS